MSLLFDEEYEYLKGCGLLLEEDEEKRFLIFKNFPLPKGLYVSNDNPVLETEVLVVIPDNYNTSGIDNLWTYPHLLRADGKAIPAASLVGGTDPRNHSGKEYCRWSRHWNKPDQSNSWKPKVDNIRTILSRIEWAFRNPDADKA